ncbi:MAG: hypothetical protein Q4G69_04510 [Planctomycetia bacterium]|nr:hypothetical protein [Planctomycetia bacterium]
MMVSGQQYTEKDIADRQVSPYPVQRLHRDWMYQDAKTLKVDACFTSKKSSDLERAMIDRVLEELTEEGVQTDLLEAKKKELVQAKKTGADPAWKELYFEACRLRRKMRLEIFNDHPREYFYVKHFVFGDAQAMFAMTDHLTDAIFRETGRDNRMNSQLCKMTINQDGSVSTRVILDMPTGIIRDPSLSYDGKTLAFSMRKADQDHGDDFHLYTMPVDSNKPTQITFGAGTADMEPEWLPNGNLIFTSTRSVFSAPCWWSSVCNLYTCDAQGRYIRRLGVDHGHTVFPHMTEDGRITYTRWEYSDRTPGYLHSLFVMNADGTNQTEYYGNNSQFPAAILHARSVPNSTKVIAIAGAHHIDQRGKLIMIDRREGTQAGTGVNYLAPERPMPYAEGHGTGGSIAHGTEGEQFQYPYPLDEDNYIVCYSPEGGSIRGLKGIHNGKQGSPAFGIYLMDRDGRRELLIYDPVVSSGQHIANKARPLPVQRDSPVDEQKNSGRFYVQDIYYGPGMKGVKRGEAKKMRIVALDYRAKGTVALGLHPWGGHQTTPCAINNGSYDVKHVLGTVDIEKDGSCYFECPSRVPVYFQILDNKGQMIQNMRSWTMVLPGEMFSCIGCHEDKNTTFTAKKAATEAVQKKPQKIKPFFEPGEEPVQEMERFLTAEEKKAMNYLSVNAPQGMDVPKGFSYTREIQPIWDEHCIVCHSGSKNPAKKDVPLSLLGDDRPVTNDEIYNRAKWRLILRSYGHGSTKGTPGRLFSESYINLTDFGYNAKIPKYKVATHGTAASDKAYLSFFNNDPSKIPNPDGDGYSSDEYSGKGIINWLHAPSTCSMIAPRSYGSCSSPLMKYLEPSHYGVQLTQKEKETVACWIDLNVPYCGSWMELNYWDKLVHNIHSALSPWSVYGNKMRQIYLYFEAKRLKNAQIELAHIAKYIEHKNNGTAFKLSDFPIYEFGGKEVQKKFVEDYDRLPQTVPIFGMAQGKNSRGGTNVEGNPVRNLALNPDAYTNHLRSYPRVMANSWYRYRPEFSPVHLIDGKTKDKNYWRPARRTDLALNLEFGREIETEKVVLTLHLTEKQKTTWTKAALLFSGGEKIPIILKPTSKPQTFTFPKVKCSSVQLIELHQTFPLTDNGIAEWEVWGKDI